jgi:ketosteroid isomerase-like protein
MGTQENRATAIRFVERMGQGVLEEALLAPDVRWWVPGTGTFTRAEFMELMEAFRHACATPVRMTIDGVTAEADRVAIEAHAEAELTNGASYRNTYHFLFEFEEGRIKHAKEYNDSKHAADTIGPLLAGDAG